MLRNKEKSTLRNKEKTHCRINFEKAHAGINKEKITPRNKEKKHTQE